MKNFIFFLFLFVNINLYSQSNYSIELDLAQCLEIALENNLQLKRSEINEKILRDCVGPFCVSYAINHAPPNQRWDIGKNGNIQKKGEL